MGTPAARLLRRNQDVRNLGKKRERRRAIVDGDGLTLAAAVRRERVQGGAAGGGPLRRERPRA